MIVCVIIASQYVMMGLAVAYYLRTVSERDLYVTAYIQNEMKKSQMQQQSQRTTDTKKQESSKHHGEGAFESVGSADEW